MVGVFLTVESKGKRQDIVVAMVRTAIVEHTLWRNSVPAE